MEINRLNFAFVDVFKITEFLLTSTVCEEFENTDNLLGVCRDEIENNWHNYPIDSVVHYLIHNDFVDLKINFAQHANRFYQIIQHLEIEKKLYSKFTLKFLECSDPSLIDDITSYINIILYLNKFDSILIVILIVNMIFEKCSIKLVKRNIKRLIMWS